MNIIEIIKEQIQWIKDFPRWDSIWLIIYGDYVLFIVVFIIMWYLLLFIRS